VPLLNATDRAVRRSFLKQPDITLWDGYGYPHRPTVEAFARDNQLDETDIWYSMKHLKSVDGFNPNFDPKKPIHGEGFFDLAEHLANANAKPFDLPPVRKTAASQIVDQAISEHVALIPEPEYETVICPKGGHEVLVGKLQTFDTKQVLEIIAPLMRAMRVLAPMFPEHNRTCWMNRVSATEDHLRKIIDSNQTEFTYPQLQAIASSVTKALSSMELELEAHLPELPPELKPPAFGLRVIRSSEVEPELIEWLWKDRIPLSKLTLFSGNPDVGKSLVSLDVAARLSCGKDFPDGANSLGECDILILASEDDPADTIVPRLMAAGADLDRIHLLTSTSTTDSERSFALDSDIGLLREHLTQNPDIRLVIIDPISNYLGRAEINKEQELRRVLTPLVNLARDANCAVLTIAHFNKQIGADAIHKTGGAVGLVGIQRMGWAFTKSPDDPDLRLMLRIKGNISTVSKGLSYRTSTKTVTIQGQQTTLPVVEWLGATSETADGVLAISANPEEKSARQVTAWLREFLPIRSSGKKLARDVYQMAESKGFSNATVRRATQQLNVERWQEQGSNGQNCWFWALPGSEEELF
jgi:putative DNA primase/helicase